MSTGVKKPWHSMNELLDKKRKEISTKDTNPMSIDKNQRLYYNEKEAVEKIYQIILGNARIPAEYRDCSFSNFDQDFIPENTEKLNDLKKFALNYDHYFRQNRLAQSVLIYSDRNGCGKTHAAVATAKLMLWEYAKKIFECDADKYKRRGIIADEIKNKTPVFFISEKKYIWCRKRFSTRNENIISFVAACENAFINSEFIIYDDLFRARDTAFYFDELESILEMRYDEKKPMIFTTNINIKTIDQIDPKINPFADKVEQGSYLLYRLEKMTSPYQFEFADYRDYRKEGIY